MKFAQFVDASYTLRSSRTASDRTLNLYPEVLENRNEPYVAALLGTPGTELFTHLPTQPVRGIWTGGAPLTSGAILYVVSGSRLYQVSEDGTYEDRGDVGDDDTHSPVYMAPNGSQMLIVSAGFAWIDNGNGPVKAQFDGISGVVDVSPELTGTVTVVGTEHGMPDYEGLTLVTRTAGDSFVARMLDFPVEMGGASYIVASVLDPDNIMVVSGPAPGTGVSYNTLWVEVTWQSGEKFDASMVDKRITIGSNTYTVASVIGPELLIIVEDESTVTPGTGLAFSALRAPVTASHGVFLDGYFVVEQPDSKRFYWSALYNGLSWDPLDYAQKEGYPDNIVAILSDHKELWLFGDTTIEVWRSNPSTDPTASAFVLDGNAYIQMGCRAPDSPTSLGDCIVWLGGDPKGVPIAWRAQGYQPVRISTHALEQEWSRYSRVDDALCYTYTDEGHKFWVITFPSADKTWVYDDTASAQYGKRIWHERSSRDGRHVSRCHAFVWGKHLVGDYDSGKLLSMSLDIYDDEGDDILRERIAPYMSEEEYAVFYSRFQLDMETGQAADPTMSLSWSDDGGRNWATDMDATAGELNDYAARVFWWRLGMGRHRAFRVRSTEAIRHAWNAAYIETLKGLA